MGGATYDAGFFEDGIGTVTAFVPVSHRFDTLRPGLSFVTIPEASVAAAMHEGPFEELDRTYGLLGRAAIERGLETVGPIREYYLVSPAETDDESQFRTEVCWPIHPSPEQHLQGATA